jgi:hypothetical protein
MFSTKGNQVISSLCALLGYYSDQWVDEPILGFLSIFSTDENPTTQFDFNTFLADNIHEQFVNFGMEGMFRYSSVLAYLFVFFQVDKFGFSMQKMDGDGKPQAVTTWTSLLKHNSTDFSFKEFIDQFYHPVVSMLGGRPEPQINDEVQRSCTSRITQRQVIGIYTRITPRSEYTGASWHRISCPSICLSGFFLWNI